MTSREIVQKAFHFQHPPRLPVDMPSLGISDLGGVGAGQAAAFKPACEGQDEWGCVWAHTEVKNMGQVKGHPLEDLKGLDKHPFPDYTDDSRYTSIETSLKAYEAEEKYITSGIFMVLFERMQALHGFENCLIDLYDDRPGMGALADKIVDAHLTLVKEITRRFPGRIHCWNVSDDWGTQQAAYISFDMWMDFFFPRYKKIFDAMHAAGCDVFVHSCGKVNEIIEGYIRAGVNVVNLQQPRALGIAEIGGRYRCISFASLADIQATLPTGDRAQIAEDAAGLMQHWATPEGGFILSDYGDGAAIGVKDAGVKRYMYEQFREWSERLYGQAPPKQILNYLQQWQVVGPFRGPVPGKVDLNLPTPVEDGFAKLGAGAVDLKAQYPSAGKKLKWKRVTADADGKVDLDECIGRAEWACAYAYTEIKSERTKEALFGFGSDDGIKVWLNGEVVHTKEIQRGCGGLSDRVSLTLRKGVNRLLLKIDNYILGWGFVAGYNKGEE